MNNKINFITLFILLLIISLLGACSKKSPGSGEKAAYEIIWYTIGTPQKDTSRVMTELSQYTQQKINATIKMVMIDWGAYNDKMRMVISSGENYDICFTSSWTNDYRTNAMKGAFLPLNDLLENRAKSLKKCCTRLF